MGRAHILKGGNAERFEQYVEPGRKSLALDGAGSIV
jgi:hypothetical protein